MATTTPPNSNLPDMTVVGLQVDSFMRIQAAAIAPDAIGLVPVRGRNGQGKSSLINAMIAALGGKADQPELPITEGAHGAEVVVDLGAIVVRRKWKRDAGGEATSKLSVESAAGQPLASPQKVLDTLRGHFADPVAFLEMKDDEQVRVVLRVLGLADDLAKLESIEKGQFEQRRDHGRDADRLEKAAAELANEVAGLPPPKTEGTVEEISAEIEAAVARNAELTRIATLEAQIRIRGVNLASQITEHEKSLEQARADLENAKQAVDDAERWIVQLNEQKTKLDQARAETAAEWKAAATALRDAPPPTDVDAIRAKLGNHEEATRFAGKQELLQQKRAEAEAARALHAADETAIAETRKQIQALLGSAKFPIPGMTYDHEKKRLAVGGVPFSQASQAQRLAAGAGIAMAGNPKIRVIFAREGSLLDKDSQAMLATMALEHGYQLWLEIVDDNPEGAGVFIEEGVVRVAGQS